MNSSINQKYNQQSTMKIITTTVPAVVHSLEKISADLLKMKIIII